MDSSRPIPSITRAYYFDYGSFQGRELTSVDEVVDSAISSLHQAVCIVENITSSWIERLEHEWGIDSEFFKTHMENPAKEHLWKNVFEGAPIYDPNRTYHSVHIPGIIEYEDWQVRNGQKLDLTSNSSRHCVQEGKYPISSNTVISYCHTLGGRLCM